MHVEMIAALNHKTHGQRVWGDACSLVHHLHEGPSKARSEWLAMVTNAHVTAVVLVKVRP